MPSVGMSQASTCCDARTLGRQQILGRLMILVHTANNIAKAILTIRGHSEMTHLGINRGDHNVLTVTA